MEKEGLKKSGLIFLIPIFFGIIVTYEYYNLLFENENRAKNITLFIMFLMLTTYCLFGLIYSLFYEIIVDNEKLIRKTMFKKLELEYSKLSVVSCERYTSLSKYYILIVNYNNTKYKLFMKHPEKVLNKIS